MEVSLKQILDEFEKWLEENTLLNEKSREQYKLQIKKFLVKYKQLNVDNLRKYLIEGDRVYNRRFAVKCFLRFLEKTDWIEELTPIMKMIKLKDRRYERYIDFDSFKKFLDKIDDELRVILMVLWDTAVRISPIINLKVNQIKQDSDGYYIYVIEKGEKATKRYLDSVTGELIKKFTVNKSQKDYVFRHKIKENENRWETWWECYYRLWKTLKTESRKFLGVGFGISFHWTRTSRAKELYKKYKDLKKVKDFLGHKRIATTERYIEGGEISSSEIIKNEKGKWSIRN